MAQQKICRFTRFAISMLQARGDLLMAAEFSRRWNAQPEIERCLKALVAPGSTTDGSWAGPLAAMNNIVSEFAEVLRPATIIGRMAGFRAAPFNIRFTKQTAGASVGWIGEMRPSPVSDLQFDEETLGHSKCGGIVVFTEELVRLSDPAAEQVIEADLIAAISQFMDQSLLDRTLAEVSGVSPASIAYGAPSFASSGSDMDSVEADLKLLVGSLNDAGIRFIAPYLIMRKSTALHLATLRNVAGGGQPLFPNVGVLGGNVWGIPVLVSDNVPVDADTPNESTITLVDAGEMLLADGNIELDASRQASLQMKTDPETGAQRLVSLWRNNYVGARVTRSVRWKMRRAEAVAVLTNVNF